MKITFRIQRTHIEKSGVEVSPDEPVGEFIERKIDELPKNLQNPQEYTYELFLVRGGKSKKLDPTRNWESQGVKENDLVIMEVDLIVAGASEIRLENEYKKIFNAFTSHPKISFKVLRGSPPVAYEITYSLTGLVGRNIDGLSLPLGNHHKMEITLDPRMYPFKPPEIIMTTTTLHPNIGASGNVCVGQIRPGGKVWDLHQWIWKDAIIQTGKMIQYRLWNLDNTMCSKARKFVIENKHKGLFPFDDFDLNEEF